MDDLVHARRRRADRAATSVQDTRDALGLFDLAFRDGQVREADHHLRIALIALRQARNQLRRSE